MSLNSFAGPLMGTPKNLNLILRADTKYLLIHNTTSSDPKVIFSTVFCGLQKAWIRALLMKIIMPVWNLCLILLPVWLASTNDDILTSLPRSSGIVGGSSYSKFS